MQKWNQVWQTCGWYLANSCGTSSSLAETVFKKKIEVEKRRSHLWLWITVIASRICKLTEKIAGIQWKIITWFSQPSSLKDPFYGNSPPRPQLTALSCHHATWVCCPPDIKEVAVVVLRPGHVTWRTAGSGGGWAPALPAPPPCYDQCVLTQCEAAGAQAMYSAMPQKLVPGCH